MKFFIKGHIIIIHGITCVSNDIIDDVIEFAKFSVADVLKSVKKWHFDQMPFLRKILFCMSGTELKSKYSSVFRENRCPPPPKPVYGGNFSHKL